MGIMCMPFLCRNGMVRTITVTNGKNGLLLKEIDEEARIGRVHAVQYMEE